MAIATANPLTQYGCHSKGNPAAILALVLERNLISIEFINLFYALLIATTSGIAWSVWLPYLSGALVLALGLIHPIRNEIAQRHGLDKLIPFGPVFLAVPMAVFGTFHFTAARFVVQVVPAWMPGHLFWVYFVGAALIAAALSIVLEKQVWLSATLLGVMLLLFVLLLHIPRLIAAPDRFNLAVALRDLAFSGGAFAIAGAQTKPWPARVANALLIIARFFIAIPVTVFGVEHFLHPDYVPGVPLDRLMPSYIPAHLLWSYVTGVVFIAAGLCLIVNKKNQQAAASVGLLVLILVLLVYVPITVTFLSDIANGLNYLVDTLALSGAAYSLAVAQREKLSTPRHRVQASIRT